MSSIPNAQICLVLGAGGVGKTTSSAALGLAMANKGLRVVVITIDPAKRLAQALGLDSLSNHPQKVSSYENGGSLHALWLDSKSALSDLVRKAIKKPELADSIVNNRLFQIIQGQLGGIEEYLSIEKLLSLGESGEYDLCILDTPPSRHALDFLEAPKHLLKFFDDGILKIFLKQEEEESKNFFKKILDSGRSQTLNIFKKFLGKSFIKELSDLLDQSKPVHSTLKRTAESMEAWIKSDKAKLVLVSLPERDPLDEAKLLSSELLAHELPQADLLILNKCLPKEALPELSSIEKSIGSEAAQSLQRRWTQQQNLLQNLPEFGPRAKAMASVPRYSLNKLNINQLLKMGEGVVQQWQSVEPNLFSKN